MMKLSFDIHLGESRKKITSDQLDELAISYGLDRIARGRYSSLFVLNLLVLHLATPGVRRSAPHCVCRKWW
jgi:hypothetical protein